jgi:hypothetical protein
MGNYSVLRAVTWKLEVIRRNDSYGRELAKKLVMDLSVANIFYRNV